MMTQKANPDNAVDQFLEGLEGRSPSDCYVTCALTTQGAELPINTGSYSATRQFLIEEIPQLMARYRGLTIQPLEEFKKETTVH